MPAPSIFAVSLLKARERMDKKKLTLVATFFAGASLIVVFAGGFSQKSLLAENDPGTYTLDFSSSTNRFQSSSTKTTQSITTPLGNPLTFEYQGLTSSDAAWGSLASGGYFRNESEIHGIASITLTMADTNPVGISFGWEYGIPYERDISLAASNPGGSVSYTFDNLHPAFIEVAYLSAVPTITSFSLSYTCEASASPSSQMIFTKMDGGTTYALSAYTGNAATVYVPSSYQGLPVTSIVSAFLGKTSLHHVVIPSSVTSIGYCAFGSCTNLSEITLPSSVTTLGESVFRGCTSLTSVSLPSSLTGLSDRLFQGCTSLTSLVIPSTITSIGASAFQGCTALSTISLPSSLTSVGANAFLNDTALTTVTFASGNAASTLGDYAFKGCSRLTSVVLPSTLTSIGIEAFEDDLALTSIAIPSSVTSIGDLAFIDTPSLASFSVGSESTTYSSDGHCLFNANQTTLITFANASGDTYTIPSSVTRIESKAFYGAKGIVHISVPASGLTSIRPYAFAKSGIVKFVGSQTLADLSEHAFEDCASLTLASLPVASTLTVMPAYCFYNCTALKEFGFPSYMTTIGQYAFSNCSALTYMEISSVTSIGEHAFEGCSSLAKVHLSDHLNRFEDHVFGLCTSLSVLYIASTGPIIIGFAFDGWTAQQSVKFKVKQNQVSFQTSDETIGAACYVEYDVGVDPLHYP
jgi:hypothetical protein